MILSYIAYHFFRSPNKLVVELIKVITQYVFSIIFLRQKLFPKCTYHGVYFLLKNHAL